MMKRMITLAVAFTAAGAVFAGRVSFSCPTESIEEYRELAAFAKSVGATHLDACQVEPSIWQWNRDRYDPYPNWSMVRPSLFKFIVPEELKDFLPADYAARNLAALKARAEVLKEFSLKSEFSGFEPAWFPEEAYVRHPEWRGARCDQCRRARAEYYAPCTDNPEVRAIYERTIAELCRVCPFEAFRMRVNDSGSGLCWSRNQYAGANGPLACRERDYADRVVEFLSMFQNGAAKAGLDGVKVNARADFRGDEGAILAKLRPGQSVNNRTARGTASELVVGFPNRFLDYGIPVLALPRMGRLVEQLQAVAAAPDADVNVGLRSCNEPDTRALLKRYLKGGIAPGPAAAGAALEATAADFVDAEHVGRLAAAWADLDRAAAQLDALDTGGHLFLLGTVHQRWLTRPLVAFPGELEGGERAYWRDYIFQAEEEERANDLLMMQGHRWLGGYGGYYVTHLVFDKGVLPRLRAAVAAFRALVPAARDAAAKEYLENALDKAEFYECVVVNAANTIHFQCLMDTVDRELPPEDTLPFIRMQGDPRLYELEEIVRAEIDNSLRMISILRRAKHEVVQHERRKELESVMTLGPDLVAQLEKRIDIMRRHRRDYTRLLKSKNL